MEIRTLFKDYMLQLQGLYSRQEAESLTFWLFEHYLGLKRLDLLKDKNIDHIPASLEEAKKKLMEGMPIQYILQSAPFYGRDFFVNPSVLIPRNETEELVHLIIRENKDSGLSILDLGTGSGCIPITLELEMKSPRIIAVDISAAALEVARKNSEKFMTGIEFLQLDVLKEDLSVPQLDILVSNPPYIPESDKSKMHRNVLEYEPHLALFVPDGDPLVFYRIIAQKGLISLRSGGKLYLEINENLGPQVLDLLDDLNYKKIRLLKDLNDKDRIIVAERI